MLKSVKVLRVEKASSHMSVHSRRFLESSDVITWLAHKEFGCQSFRDVGVKEIGSMEGSVTSYFAPAVLKGWMFE